MDNLELYNRVRSVPDNAKREIKGGRLKGKTDINPMWRIKVLTETFGPCGIGWKYTIKREWLENGTNGEIAAFVDIDLFYKADGQWSEAVPGTGGSMLVTSERNGLYTSDECFKMALTDAISVAAKALGVAADVYWDADSTKYGRQYQDPLQGEKPAGTGQTKKDPPAIPEVCECCGRNIRDAKNSAGDIWMAKDIATYSHLKYGKKMCVRCIQDADKQSEMAAGQ